MSRSVAVQFERAAPDAPESLNLMQEFWREIDHLYGNAAPTQWQLIGMEDPRSAFVIVRREHDAVACAALRPLTDSTVELKRMYVRPEARRRGIARQLVHHMEQLARDASFSELWLETGLRQPAAVALYERLGYTRRAAFGDHKGDPLNVCFEKQLT
jgi:GNAT superfamily N-acetyltransferase